jgi:addiction module HigA family antidote
MALKMHPSLHVHPGDWLRTEVVEAHNMPINEAADRLGVTRQTVSRLLNGHHGLSAEMALRVEKVFGVKADTLLRMQAAYDLANARAHEADLHVRALEMA